MVNEESLDPVQEEIPVEETPVEDTPVEETPVEETPVEDTPVEDTPVEETPVEDTPVEETPVEDTPVEETPVEDTPVEETPVEDTPVEDTPVEKSEEGVTEDVTLENPEEDVSLDETDYSEDFTVVRTYTVTSPDVLETLQPYDVSSVMADVVTGVLGEYERMTYTVEEYDTDGNLLAVSTQYVPGLAGLDYAWITGAIIFIVFFTGTFKLLGGLIRR